MKQDAEVLAIQRIRAVLDKLPQSARLSVLEYVNARVYRDGLATPVREPLPLGCDAPKPSVG